MDELCRDTIKFQSTLSVRRATEALGTALNHFLFQSTLSVRRATAENLLRSLMERAFQSTLSVRRATRQAVVAQDECLISIHALRKESDRKPSCRTI